MALVANSCYGQPVYIEAPEVTPLPYGLFSVSDIIDAPDGHWQQGVEWEAERCGAASVYACPTCVQNNGGTAPAKTYAGGRPIRQAFPFTVYGSFACSPIGNWDRAEEFARRLLLNGEERAVENEIALGTNHTAGLRLVDATAVDITPTPGTPVTPQQGLALLEQYGALNGNGRFVVLGARRDVALINATGQLLILGDGRLHTTLGTPFGALGGFNARTGPNGVAAAAGNAWLFAIGQPRIWRSPIDLVDSREHSLDQRNNNLRILAERTYVVGWDCFTAGVLITSVGTA